MLACSSASYAAKYENKWCFYWVYLHKLEECNRHKKGFNQREKSGVHRSAFSRFVEASSSTDDIVGTVTKNLLEIQQKNFLALMKILSSIRYLTSQRLPLRSHNDSESNFRQLLLLRAEDDPKFQEWLLKETNRFTSSEMKF